MPQSMSRSGSLHMAGFQVIIYGRFWVITEEYDRWCSRPIQTEYLFDYGKEAEGEIVDFILPDYTPRHEGFLYGVQDLLGEAIRSAIDFRVGNDKEFEYQLQQLVDKLRDMRKQSKNDWLVIG